MTLIFLLPLLLLLLLAVVIVVAENNNANLLLVGNSYTPIELQTYIIAMLKEDGSLFDNIDVRRSDSGQNFAVHLQSTKQENTNIRKWLITEPVNWTWIVLQEQSQIGGWPGGTHNTYESAIGLNNIITENVPNAETIFMMTWGRRDGDSANPGIYPDFLTMNNLLDINYNKYINVTTSTSRPTRRAPVGLAFKYIYDSIITAGEDPLQPGSTFHILYQPDGSHPSKYGIYLQACVIYMTLTGNDPRDITYNPSLIENIVIKLRNAAYYTVIKEPTLFDSERTCFSSTNTVDVLNKGIIPITDLQIGDYVRTSSASETSLKYSRVYSFGHKDPIGEATYLQIYCNGTTIENPLEISYNHMLYVNGEIMKAKDVRIGDYLGRNNYNMQVIKISNIRRHGLYAPITESGIIVVSGIKVSTYVSLLNDINPSYVAYGTHIFLSPLRIICAIHFSFCKQETYNTNNGLSNNYINFIKLTMYLGTYNQLIQYTVISIVSVLMVFVYMVERLILLSTPYYYAIIILIFFLLTRNKFRRKLTL